MPDSGDNSSFKSPMPKVDPFSLPQKDIVPLIPALATKIFSYLNPQPEDVILDIGCGAASLTAKIARSCSRIIGVDGDPSSIESANKNIQPCQPNATFVVADCRRVSSTACETESINILKAFEDNKYDKVFSYAAMHRILRDDGNRVPFFADILDLLKPGGKLVFELEGHGNAAAMHTGLISVLHFKYGIPLERIRRTGNPSLAPGDPWFFPSRDWVRHTLECTGFEVDLIEEEYCPIRMSAKGQDAEAGLKNYVRSTGADLLDMLECESEREAALVDVCEIMADSTRRLEDGSHWFGCVRLRVIARKPIARRMSSRSWCRRPSNA